MACGCGECHTLSDGVAPFYTSEQRMQTKSGPLFMGLYTREAWDEHSKLFIFRCSSCEQVRYAFPCYERQDPEWYALPHFHCEWCVPGLYVIMHSSTYIELGIEDPPRGWRYFIQHVMRMFTEYPPPCVRRAGLHP